MSIGTIMLSGSGVPLSRTCCTCSEPIPSSSPDGPIIAVPPQNGWAGAVKIASSRTYSQLPANSCLAAMRAATECLRPPAPATTTGSPTFAVFDWPIGSAGNSSRASACTSPKPVSWS